MNKPINATKLRANIYRVLDRVIKTGESAEVKRRDQKLLIISQRPHGLKLENLPKRNALACTPEELVETSWDREWKSTL
jgi:hypothetical protein